MHSDNTLQARIEAAQEKAYSKAGLTDILLLYMTPELLSARLPSVIERIVEAQYSDRSRQVQKFVRQHLKQNLALNKKTSPIRFQNQHYHQHLTYYWDLIREHVPDITLPEPAYPLIATLPTVSLNAGAWKIRGCDGYALVFNESLLTFLFLLAKIVARYFPAQFIPNPGSRDDGQMAFLFDHEQVNRILTTDTSGLQDFVNLLTGHISKGNPLADTRPYLLDHNTHLLAAHLIRSSELFVFAHELAHIVNGDLDSPGQKTSDLGADFDHLLPGHQKELKADERALLWLIEVSEKTTPLSLSLDYWGVELFLSAVELSERAVTFLKYGEERQADTDSHPAPDIRRENLRLVMRRHVTQTHPSMPDFPESEYAINHAQILVDLVNALWSDARELLRAASVIGVPIAPRWNAIYP
jgi:hypothetical protein